MRAGRQAVGHKGQLMDETGMFPVAHRCLLIMALVPGVPLVLLKNFGFITLLTLPNTMPSAPASAGTSLAADARASTTGLHACALRALPLPEPQAPAADAAT